MSIFKAIDQKLALTAKELGATLTKDRPGYPEALRTFEERRIDWTHLGVKKAIIIQPIFELQGVDSSRWNFNTVAWTPIGSSSGKRTWKHQLMDKVHFDVIEQNIDTLLSESRTVLSAVTQADLS